MVVAVLPVSMTRINHHHQPYPASKKHPWASKNGHAEHETYPNTRSTRQDQRALRDTGPWGRLSRTSSLDCGASAAGDMALATPDGRFYSRELRESVLYRRV